MCGIKIESPMKYVLNKIHLDVGQLYQIGNLL